VRRGWLTFWLVFVVLSWILSAVLMVAALAADDFGRAGFNLALVLVNTWALGVIAGARADA